MATTLDFEKLAAMVRELTADMDMRCEVRVCRPSANGDLSLDVESPTGDPARRPVLYARVARQFSRSFHARAKGWQLSNGGGYGEAETRTFGVDPDLNKLAASVSEVAHRRAARLAAKNAERAREDRNRQIDDETVAKLVELTGMADRTGYAEDDVARVRPENGTGRVVVKVKGIDPELRCWPEQVKDAIRSLQRWQVEVNTFGQPRKS